VSDRDGSAPAGPPPVLVRTKAELAAVHAGRPGPVVLVPTMGALHAGHATLLRAAAALAGPAGRVVVSIFVNPLQFGPSEDLDRYPRTMDDDLAMCAGEGVHLVFAPSAAEMYPRGKPEVTVDSGPMGRVFEGQFRPGFFEGVLTVVLKLLHLTRPATVVFGEKDAQQLALVRRMVSDTDLNVVVESVPTARDADGLAISSRNRYLSAAEVLAAAQRVLVAEPALTVDYLALVDPGTFTSVPPGYAGPALLIAAAKAGGTRLIDNVPVVPAGDSRPGDAVAEGRVRQCS
jgi:pantoate--beta-alanine ligase